MGIEIGDLSTVTPVHYMAVGIAGTWYHESLAGTLHSRSWINISTSHGT